MSQFRLFSSSSTTTTTATTITTVMAIILLLSGTIIDQVECGKKDKILLGLAVGHALHSRARDHSMLRLIIPIRLATEAWKHYGEISAHHGHHYGHHHGGGHHYGVGGYHHGIGGGFGHHGGGGFLELDTPLDHDLGIGGHHSLFKS